MAAIKIDLEDIEEIRRRAGIDDVELRQEIRGLGIGDLVRLTILTGATTFELLPVRITSIRGDSFRGKLARKPTSASLSKLPAGAPVTFTTAHIHSLPKGQPTCERHR